MEFFTYSGTDVIDLNRRATSGELEGTYTPDELVHKRHAEFYSVVDGKLVPKTDSEVAEIKAAGDKAEAFSVMSSRVELEKEKHNSKNFPYAGYTYKSNKSAKADIEGVFGQCGYGALTDVIPTFLKTPSKTGKWLTVEGDYIPFTKEEFIKFAQAYFDRFSWNFDNMVLHLEALAVMNADSSITAEEILNYDITTGWE